MAAAALAVSIVVGSGVYAWTHTGGDRGEPTTAGGSDPRSGTSTGVPGTSTAEKTPNPYPVAHLSPSGIGGFCAVLTTGRAYCWGYEVKSATPQPVQMNPVEHISIGFATCIVSRGEVWCWQNSGDTRPAKKEGVAGATWVETKVSTVCAIAVGDVYCLGANNNGTVGDGTHERRDTPTRVNGPVGATALTLDMSTACAVASGDLWCWGDNSFGQLGDGHRAEPMDHSENRPTPEKVAGLGRVTAAATEGGRTCAISDGDVFCWGRTLYELSVDSRTPVSVPAFGKVTALSVGQESVCAIRVDGTVVCGGSNRYGQLGVEADPDFGQVVVVKGISGAISVAANNKATCAATADATYCWGNNGDGQLGDGTTVSRKSPVLVRWPN